MLGKLAELGELPHLQAANMHGARRMFDAFAACSPAAQELDICLFQSLVTAAVQMSRQVNAKHLLYWLLPP
jgi:hypothetical protein